MVSLFEKPKKCDMIKKIAIFQKKERYTMEQNLTFADLGLSSEVLQALEQKG